jgi:hypothetical protein
VELGLEKACDVSFEMLEPSTPHYVSYEVEMDDMQEAGDARDSPILSDAVQSCILQQLSLSQVQSQPQSLIDPWFMERDHHAAEAGAAGSYVTLPISVSQQQLEEQSLSMHEGEGMGGYDGAYVEEDGFGTCREPLEDSRLPRLDSTGDRDGDSSHSPAYSDVTDDSQARVAPRKRSNDDMHANTAAVKEELSSPPVLHMTHSRCNTCHIMSG